ncbi:hypothetical protein AB1L05_08955 [Cytobacillus horneckiae]|uniref:hypothetical protein n=1 Tax=Cytobacillus horneckiae TaxID=549687 RepID=UPI0039A05223
MDNLLKLFKLDLGITHNLRDDYFNILLASAKSEVEGKGIKLEITEAEDMMLVIDYAAWLYRKRQENLPLSRSLQFRLHCRIIKEAGQINAES